MVNFHRKFLATVEINHFNDTQLQWLKPRLGYQCALFYWWLFPWYCMNRNNLVENFALLFIAEGHEKLRNWLNSTISTMHFLVEFNHSNHSGFLNSITCWIQPIQPISSLMVVPEKTRLWVSPIFFFKWTIGPNSLSDEKISKIKSNHVLKKLRNNVF